MTKEKHRTTTRKRFSAAMLAGMAAAIPVIAIVPASAATSIGQPDPGGSIIELSAPAPPPPNLWTPNGCANRNCRHWGQDNNGCNANSNHAGTNRPGCGNTPSNGGTGNRPSTANAMTAI